MLQEVLGGSRKDVDLKSDEERPPNYRQFRADPTLPLLEPLEPKKGNLDWKRIQKEYECKTGKRIAIVKRHPLSTSKYCKVILTEWLNAGKKLKLQEE